MSQPNLGELMAKAQEVQAKLAQVQADLARRRVEGSAGGGMVTAVATGALRILEIRIEPELWDSGDRAMIQDLTAAAVNAAFTSAQKIIQEEMQRASQGLTIPLPPQTPGGGSS